MKPSFVPFAYRQAIIFQIHPCMVKYFAFFLSLEFSKIKESVEGSLTRCDEKEGTGHLGSAVSYQL